MLRPAKKTPLYLFLRNIFKQDCLGNIDELDVPYYDMKLSQFAPSIDSSNEELVKNPDIFESLDTWPRSTNLRCWYCFNQFVGPPKFIPVVIEPNTKKDNKNKKLYSISVEGNFCRWPCCMSYIKETTSGDLVKYMEKCNNLYFLYYIWNGVYPKFIPMAPTKYLQNIFGGDLTMQKYYDRYNKLEETINEYI